MRTAPAGPAHRSRQRGTREPEDSGRPEDGAQHEHREHHQHDDERDEGDDPRGPAAAAVAHRGRRRGRLAGEDRARGRRGGVVDDRDGLRPAGGRGRGGDLVLGGQPVALLREAVALGGEAVALGGHGVQARGEAHELLGGRGAGVRRPGDLVEAAAQAVALLDGGVAVGLGAGDRVVDAVAGAAQLVALGGDGVALGADAVQGLGGLAAGVHDRVAGLDGRAQLRAQLVALARQCLPLAFEAVADDRHGVALAGGLVAGGQRRVALLGEPLVGAHGVVALADQARVLELERLALPPLDRELLLGALGGGRALDEAELGPARARARGRGDGRGLGGGRAVAAPRGPLGQVGRAQRDDDAGRHGELGRVGVQRLARPREGGDPVHAVLGRPRLVVEQGEHAAVLVPGGQDEGGADEAHTPDPVPAALELEAVRLRPREAADLEGLCARLGQ